MDRISTTSYENSHGRKPRGRGMWMFLLANGYTMSGCDTYTEARKGCAEEARKMGTRLVEVLP